MNRNAKAVPITRAEREKMEAITMARLAEEARILAERTPDQARAAVTALRSGSRRELAQRIQLWREEHSRPGDLLEPLTNRKSRRLHWTVVQVEDRMHQTGKIRRHERDACTRWRGDWDMGMEGVRPSPLKERVDGAQGSERESARLMALDRLRAAENSLGDACVRILRRVLVDGWTWVKLAEAVGVHEQTLRDWTVKIIQALAVHYDLVDGVNRQGGGEVVRAVHGEPAAKSA